MAKISGCLSCVSGVWGLLSLRCGEGSVGSFRGVRQSVRPRLLHGCSEKAEQKRKCSKKPSGFIQFWFFSHTKCNLTRRKTLQPEPRGIKSLCRGLL